MTWDVDGGDSAMCARLRRFIFGKTVGVNNRTHRCPGFVELDGVRYLGQSVVFVTPERLEPLLRFLRERQVDHVVMRGSLGSVSPG